VVGVGGGVGIGMQTHLDPKGVPMQKPCDPRLAQNGRHSSTLQVGGVAVAVAVKVAVTVGGTTLRDWISQ